jgi:hypothetical protein
MAVRLSALRAGRPLPLRKIPVLISVRGWFDPRAIVRLEGLGQLKIPITLSGMKPATFRLVICEYVKYNMLYNGDGLRFTIFLRVIRWGWRWTSSASMHHSIICRDEKEYGRKQGTLITNAVSYPWIHNGWLTDTHMYTECVQQDSVPLQGQTAALPNNLMLPFQLPSL